MTVQNTPQEVLHLITAPETTEPSSALPVVFNIDDGSSPADVIDVLSLRPAAAGTSYDIGPEGATLAELIALGKSEEWPANADAADAAVPGFYM
jgi:hypothetical protein